MPIEALIEPTLDATPIVALREADLDAWLQSQPASVQQWVRRAAFRAQRHMHLFVPADTPFVLLGLGENDDRWSTGSLPTSLPPGDYRLDPEPDTAAANAATLAWALGAYRYTRYRAAPREAARLCWPQQADRATITREATSVMLARDLINCPPATWARPSSPMLHVRLQKSSKPRFA
jgi:leucyl aminopeptidase